MRDEPALFADAKRRQPKSGCGDASQVIFLRDAHVAAVAYDAGFGIGLLPEVSKIGGFQFLQESFVLRGKWLGRFRPGRSAGAGAGASAGSLRRKEMRQACERGYSCRFGHVAQQFPAGQPPAVVSVPTHQN